MLGRWTDAVGGRLGTPIIGALSQAGVLAASSAVAPSNGVLIVVLEIGAGFIAGRVVRGGWLAVMFGVAIGWTAGAMAITSADFQGAAFQALLAGFFVFTPGYLLGSGSREAEELPYMPETDPAAGAQAGWTAIGAPTQPPGSARRGGGLSNDSRLRIGMLMLGGEALLVLWVFWLLANSHWGP